MPVDALCNEIYNCVVICHVQQVTARQVQSSLIPILQTFHERSLYLDCLLNPVTPSLAVLHAGLKNNEERKEEGRKEDKALKGALKLVCFLFVKLIQYMDILIKLQSCPLQCLFRFLERTVISMSCYGLIMAKNIKLQ